MATFRRAPQCKQANAFIRLPLIRQSRHLGVVNIPDLHMTIAQNWVISCLSAGVPQLLLLRSAEIRHTLDCVGLHRNTLRRQNMVAFKGNRNCRHRRPHLSTPDHNADLPGTGEEKKNSAVFGGLNELWQRRKQLSLAHPASIAINHCRTIGTRLCSPAIKIDGRALGFRLGPAAPQLRRKLEEAKMCSSSPSLWSHPLSMQLHFLSPFSSHAGGISRFVAGAFLPKTLPPQTCSTLTLHVKRPVTHGDYSARTRNPIDSVAHNESVCLSGRLSEHNACLRRGSSWDPVGLCMASHLNKIIGILDFIYRALYIKQISRSALPVEKTIKKH